MAITITQQPGTINAAYRPIIYKVTSDDVNIVRIIADVRIDGVIKANIDKDPIIGTSDQFEFDIQNICQDFLTFTLLAVQQNDIVNADNSVKRIQVDFYEVTEVAGVLETGWQEDGSGSPDITSASRRAINMTLQHTENQSIDPFLNDDITKSFLTHAPLTVKIRRTETIQLSFLTTLAIRFQIVERDKNNNIINVNNSNTFSLTDFAGILLIDVNTMLSNTVRFEVRLLDINFNVRSEKRFFEIDEKCHDIAIRLKWLNQLGGLDSYTFTGKQERFIKHKSISFERLLSPTFSIEDRGETHLEIKANNEFNLWSDVRDVPTIKWLEELLANKINVWINNNEDFTPIIILDGSTKTEDTEDPVFQINIKYKFANELISQRN